MISAETVKTDRPIRAKLEERFADTFILRDGRWKVVANYYVRADAKLPTIDGNPRGLSKGAIYLQSSSPLYCFLPSTCSAGKACRV